MDSIAVEFHNEGKSPRVVFNDKGFSVLIPPGITKTVQVSEGTFRQMTAFCAKDTSLRMRRAEKPAAEAAPAEAVEASGEAQGNKRRASR